MSKTLTLANTGDADLTLSSLNLPAGFSADLSLPTTVPPSGSRAFTLSLNADAGGSFGGTASLLSNDAAHSPFTLALSGTVTADLPPTVRITAPQDGTSVVVGTHVPVMATASDDGVVEEVDFFATDAYGGTYWLGTGLGDGTGDYALDLDTARLPPGVYLLQAQTYDDRGQSTTSDPVTLTVTAVTGDFGITPSPVSLTAPAGGSGQSAVQLTPTGGFVGAVHLTVTGDAGILGSPGDPTKISAVFTPASVRLDGAAATSTLTLAAGAQVTPGTYSLQITGTDMSGTRVHSVPVNVTVTAGLDFSLSVDSPDIKTGETDTGTVSIAEAHSEDINIALTTNNPALKVDPSVVIKAGSLSNTFHYTAADVPIPTPDIDFPIPANGVISATYDTISHTMGVQVNQAELTAVATGHQKITLYWAGFGSSTLYNVYRTTTPDGLYTLVASHVSTLDNGPGVTGTYMYSDTNGLVDGVRYYYYVVAVVADNTETYHSSIASDVPDPGAVPYDTGDPVQIVAAMTAQLNSVLPVDDPDDDISYGVGLLAIGGPDGVIYEGGMPGEEPSAYASPVHIDAVTGDAVSDDGTLMPFMQDVGTSGSDYAGTSSAAVANIAQSKGLANRMLEIFELPSVLRMKSSSIFNDPGSRGQVLTQDLNYPYPCIGGIERKVETFPGFVQLLTTKINLPMSQVGLVYLDKTLYFNKQTATSSRTQDHAYIYTGGSILYDHHPGQEDKQGAELDAGLELQTSNSNLDPGWTPFVNAGTHHVTVFGKTIGAAGNDKRGVYFDGNVGGGTTMNFSTGAIMKNVIPNQIAVHFLGNYRLLWKKQDGTVDKVFPQGGGTFFGPVTLTSVSPGWSYPHGQDVSIKRMNTIAQVLQHKSGIHHNETVEFNHNDSHFWEGSWGDNDDTLGRLRYFDGSVYSWEEDETWRSGAHPLGAGSWGGGSGGYVWWAQDNPFYSERSINLSTTDDFALSQR